MRKQKKKKTNETDLCTDNKVLVILRLNAAKRF